MCAVTRRYLRKYTAPSAAEPGKDTGKDLRFVDVTVDYSEEAKRAARTQSLCARLRGLHGWQGGTGHSDRSGCWMVRARGKRLCNACSTTSPMTARARSPPCCCYSGFRCPFYQFPIPDYHCPCCDDLRRASRSRLLLRPILGLLAARQCLGRNGLGGLGRYVELVSGVSWSRNCQTFAADFLTLLVGRSSLTRLRAAPISFC